MFYSDLVLSKKGALGKVWLAAHWEKKLTRNQMTKSNIVEACSSIIKPMAPLALRTSGHLLLGVVRIHDSKQKSLMYDCSDALVKIKLAFRPGTVDLPANKASSVSAITMAETFADFESDEKIAELGDGLDDSRVSLNIGSAHEITMTEDLTAIDVVAPNMGNFGEETWMAPIPFLEPTAYDDGELQEPEKGRDRDVESSFRDSRLEDSGIKRKPDADHYKTTMDDAADIPEVAQIPEDADLVDPLDQSGFDNSGFNGGFDSTFDTTANFDAPASFSPVLENPDQPNESFMSDPVSRSSRRRAAATADEPAEEPAAEEELNAAAAAASSTPFQTIAPIAADPESSVTAPAARRKRRKFQVDTRLEIASDVMRNALLPEGPDDITRTAYSKKRGAFDYDRIPFSEEAHQYRLQDQSAEALFSRPAMDGMCPELLQMFTRNMVTTPRGQAAQHTSELEEAPETRQDEPELGRNADGSFEFRPESADPLLDAPQDEPALFDDVPEPIPEDVNESRLDETVGGLDDTADVTLGGANTSIDVTLDERHNTSAFDLALEDDSGGKMVTSEEFEDGRLNKRTTKMMSSLRTGFESEDVLSYNDMTSGKTRRIAAACIFELLVLKTKGYINVDQTEAYGDITIAPTQQLIAA